MKWSLLLLTIPLLFFFVPGPKTNRSFSLQTICIPSEFNTAWEGRSQSEEEIRQTQEALSQSYRFIGGGGQCFSFVSQDGKYVIKFFKRKTPPWAKICTWKIQKSEAQQGRVFSSFLLCFDQLPEETGMIYLHFNPTQHLGKTLAFCDISGEEHLLNLDEMQFVVQKRAELANHRLEALIASHNLEGAQHAIDQLIGLCLQLHQKGVYNRDPNFRSNYGFKDGKPIVVDIGRMVVSQKTQEEEVRHFATKFRFYLAHHHPELVDYFDAAVLKAVHE